MSYWSCKESNYTVKKEKKKMMFLTISVENVPREKFQEKVITKRTVLTEEKR
jgi:hypothetical protein